MKNKIILIALFCIGCNSAKKCEFRISDESTLDSITMWAITTNDTCWNEMEVYGDSVINSSKDYTKYGYAFFIYPLDANVKFEPNSFAVEKVGKSYVIMSYIKDIDDDSIEVEYKPELFIKAKVKENSRD